MIHCNHPDEIDEDVSFSLKAIHRRGITLLNQSVLLANINDDSQILIKLSEKLYSNHTLPYYLHLLDKVAGAAHFDVPEARAQGIMRDLRARLPGYLVPKLVREVAGAAAKVPR